jgi:cell fate regulator YaaT (PSP1 superfamily)
MDVFDWLAGIELPLGQRPFDIVEVRFKNGRKSFYRKSDLEVHVGDVILVDAAPGYDVGIVSLTGELVRIQMQKKGSKDNHEVRKVLRKATEEDILKWQEARKLEDDTMFNSRVIARELGLQMKISDVEYQGDKTKAVFFYTAEDRVDFRELIRKLAENFNIKIEMRQIGMRQESGRLGGIGSCGRELCCSSWLTDFRSVSTSAARYQQLSLNPAKLAGQCGKLKCCLNYELDQYVEAIKDFPPANTKLKTEKGVSFHFKTDIFKGIMYFINKDEAGGSPVAIPLDKVKEIVEMNERGETPASLRDFSVVEEVEVEESFLNVVGQDSLTRFDQKKRSKKRRSKGQSRPKKGRDGKSPRPEAKTGDPLNADNKPTGEKSAKLKPRNKNRRKPNSGNPNPNPKSE